MIQNYKQNRLVQYPKMLKDPNSPTLRKNKRIFMSYTTPLIEYMHTLSSQSNTKEFSGRSAAKWIDIFAVAGIQYQMRYTMRSVQQIAYDMNFPNQSFFGKSFRAHVGCSPKVYRLR